jgi:hypothetical protein
VYFRRGTQIALDFVAVDGGMQRIVLPVDALSGSMMTLPRILHCALDQRFPGGSLRIVQRLGNWQLEQQESDDSLILKPRTRKGFEVAFALGGEHAGSLGAALLDAPHDPEHTLVRRPN